MNDPYIWTDKGYITTQQSNEIIKRFEYDKIHQYQGEVGSGNEKYRLDILRKNSKDIYISNLPHWQDTHNLCADIVQKALVKYVDFLNKHYNLTSFTTGKHMPVGPAPNLYAVGFAIQKTSPGQGYTWHSDYTKGRQITYILYLNTVEEGWTQFDNGQQVAPELGKVLMFPATWSYVHQGYPPKQTKYIMTGWLYENE